MTDRQALAHIETERADKAEAREKALAEAAQAYYGCLHDDDARCEHWRALGEALRQHDEEVKGAPE